MSREIKFRAWDGFQKKMFDIKSLKLPHREDLSPEVYLMQYTGLLDKNGKEIYEGDIVKFYPVLDDILKGKDPLATTVSYDDGCFYVLKMNTDMCLLIDAAKAWNNYEKGGIEIIGNIYEHPHLLENK